MELSKVGLLLAKIESTYGTDPTPTVGANVIAVVRNQVTLDLDAENIDRDLLDGGFGRSVGVNAMKRSAIKFRTELRGNLTTAASNTDIASGEAANQIEISPLLRACDLSETYVAESSDGARDGFVYYRPTVASAEGSSVTFYFYSQAKLYKITGAKGNIANLGFEAGKFPFIDWEFSGNYVLPVDASFSTPTFLATKPPQWQTNTAALSGVSVTGSSGADTITYTSHGLFNGDRVKFGGTPPAPLVAGTWYYVRDRAANTFKAAATLNGSAIDLTDNGTSVTMTAAAAALWDAWTGTVLKNADLKLGNTVVMREDGNAAEGVRGFVITDRDSTMEINPESVAEATHPFWTDWASRRVKPIRLNAGTAAGNRIALEANLCINKISYADENGKRIAGCACSIRQSNPGDTPGSELTLIFQ